MVEARDHFGEHRFRAECHWLGSTASGYDGYSRAHLARALPAEGELTLSADPAFRGDLTLLNPEQLVVLAASSCQLLSFLAVAARARIDVLQYDDDAEGAMTEGERPMRISRIWLRPTITVGPECSAARVRRLVEVAHRECFIANSLRSEITIEPTIVGR
jgi:organic hydroperoxide reductase OsmC/OhrA